MAESTNARRARGGEGTQAPRRTGDGVQGESPVRAMRSRVKEFRDLARRREVDACTPLPTALTGQDRRLHVRFTIIEDHAVRIDSQAQGIGEKFDKLAGSLYSFFRGTSLLFHRDMAGVDARMPTVLVLGDVHPKNFGVMPNADNVPVFGVNDFDDAIYGPFTWDLKRGTVGFMIAAREEGGFGRKRQRRIARRFLEGYLDGMAGFARHAREHSEEIRPDNAPPIIRQLFDDADQPREEWLWSRYLGEHGRGFRTSEELTPLSSRVPEFQEHVDALARKNGIEQGGRTGALRVKDVAMRHGQGTASLGLARYYCLLEGPAGDATDDLIIEFKRARRSALEGLVPDTGFDAGELADRIAHGQAVHLARGDVFYGSADIDGMSFMSRERAPFREDMDLDDLSKAQWKAYAHACGTALANAHARSDEAGQLDYDIEPSILEAMEPAELFVDDLLAFATESVERLRRDHASFRADLALKAFDMTPKQYR